MPKISQKKKDKISEQILHYLFTINPDSAHTNKIADELARDEEFTKALLLELKSKDLVVLINKNSQGKTLQKRQRWKLSTSTYQAYKQHQI
tara:strand:- start:540 stop:812 length:273 start_codon:yes stop_codon:yes gene_type:complete